MDLATIIWPDNAADALHVQNELRHQVRIEAYTGDIKTIAGVDCSFPAPDISRAVIAVLDAKTLQPVETITADLPVTFPYISGFLSFREIPVILEALKKLKSKPDLFMVDGAGVAHPRRFGIAAHLGVLIDAPTIGVAKSRLCGKHEMLEETRLAEAALIDKDERIGTVLRSKEKCLPLYVSPGHRVGQEQAVDIVKRCLTTYRLPEPTRIADKISKQKKTGEGNASSRQTELSSGLVP